MKNLLITLTSCALFWACGTSEEKTVEYPKNNDWNAQNLKGTVKTVETTSYTPDSTGAIGAPDSCCAATEMYDEKGYTTGFESKTLAGAVSASMSMTRFDGGQPKAITNMKDGKKSNSFEIEIDANGKYTKATSFDSTGAMDRYYTDITENEYGAVLGAIAHKPDGALLESFASTYNGALMTGNVTKDSSGKVSNEYTVELNDKGDQIKSTSVQHGKDSTTTTVSTMTYDSYDDMGNWTQRTTYNDKGKATKVEKRVITYYEKKE